MMWWFIFMGHPNKKCNNVARSRPGSNCYIIIVPANSTTWTGRVAQTVLRSWTSLLSTEALLIGADVTARCRELSK